MARCLDHRSAENLAERELCSRSAVRCVGVRALFRPSVCCLFGMADVQRSVSGECGIDYSVETKRHPKAVLTLSVFSGQRASSGTCDSPRVPVHTSWELKSAVPSLRDGRKIVLSPATLLAAKQQGSHSHSNSVFRSKILRTVSPIMTRERGSRLIYTRK